MAPGPTRIVNVLTPATALFGGQPIDLVSLADVKLELDLTDTSDDAWLAKTITRLSAAANAYCSRTLAAQTYVERVWPFRDPYPFQSPTRTMPLQLARWPLAATPSASGTAPPVAPTLSASPGGALAARAYSVRLSYVTPTGETAAGLPGALALAASNLAAVASPAADRFGVATGFHVYAATAAGQETRQTLSPIAIGQTWTEPTSGLASGAALPSCVLAVENVQANSSLGPAPLAEGAEFTVDADLGHLSRISLDGYVRSWSETPIEIVYAAGFTAATIPPDLSDALIQLTKSRWFGRLRDPLVRQENVVGVLERTFALGAGLGAESDFPPEIAAKLERYRVPVVA